VVNQTALAHARVPGNGVERQRLRAAFLDEFER
jgi:hypothetical protein